MSPGRGSPSIPALARLVDAADFELTLGMRRPPGRLRQLTGPVDRRVRRHRKHLIAAAAAHGVSDLRVFRLYSSRNYFFFSVLVKRFVQ
jgi:hypothetical protein